MTPLVAEVNMRTLVIQVFLTLATAIIAASGPASAAPPHDELRAHDEPGLCKPYTWLFGSWTAPPRIPLLADISGDGYADFLYASPGGKSIDISLNGKGLKPLRGKRLVSNLPEEIRAVCSGHFGGKTCDLAVL